MDGAAYLRAPDAVTGELFTGTCVVAVVERLGRVVVGALIGVGVALIGVMPWVVGVESAVAAAGVKARRPTTATAPTRATGATTRLRSTLAIRGPIYLSRNRQA